MTSFYRLCRDPQVYDKGLKLHYIKSQTRIDLPWLAGQAFAKPPTQMIECTLHGDRGATDLPDAFLFDTIPTFSGRLVHCLQAAGVTNLETYPATLKIADGPVIAEPYFGVNVVGLVGADMSASKYDPESWFPMIDFDELHIDPAAAHGARLFRLAENPAFIIVTEEIKRAMEALPLIDVCALPLDNPAVY
jgi:hypothetical protein